MGFRFRLEVPLRLARARRRAARREFADALRRLATAEAALVEGARRHAQLGEEMAASLRAGLDGNELRALTAAREAARARLPALRARRADAAAGEERARVELARTTQEVNVLERLRHEARLAWQRELARREQASIDDVVLVRRARAAAGEAGR